MKRYRIPTHLTVEPSLVRAELGPHPGRPDLPAGDGAGLAAGFAYWLWQGSGLPTALVDRADAGGAGGRRSLAAFVTVGGRSADLWLRDLLHYAARPRRLAWRAADAASPADAPSAAWAEAPLALAWPPPRPAEAAD